MSGGYATKRFRRLARCIKPYGYKIRVLRSGHQGIFNEAGERIYTMSGSPKVREYAESNTLKDLKREGLVPKGATL